MPVNPYVCREGSLWLSQVKVDFITFVSIDSTIAVPNLEIGNINRNIAFEGENVIIHKIWGALVSNNPFGYGSKPWYPVVHIKFSGKWMLIPAKIVLKVFSRRKHVRQMALCITDTRWKPENQSCRKGFHDGLKKGCTTESRDLICKKLKWEWASIATQKISSIEIEPITLAIRKC